ncbi:CHAT domain-containing protein [Streptomyces sp. NPDC001388]|uniref:CHAT domain-containing protein n=1 Tax=Streptomyces sp. NPDC001388 TaxID=3364568 RepID=UPI0036920A54
MSEERVVDLHLTDARITESGPGAEAWSATITLELPGAPRAGKPVRGETRGLRGLVGAFRRDADGSRALGRALRDLLLPEAVEDALFDTCMRDLRPDDLLVVRLHARDAVFAALPWELTRTRFPPTGPTGRERELALVNRDHRCVLSRIVGSGTAPGPKEPLRSLVVSAAGVHGRVVAEDGSDLGRVDAVHADSLKDAVWTASSAADQLGRLGATDVMEEADVDRFAQALADRTHIVCVIAHGVAPAPRTSGILLHQPGSASPDLVTAEKLAGLLREAETQLAVLVSCNTAGGMLESEGWGTTAEQLVSSGVPAVVAMQSAVEPTTGHDFLYGLVEELGRHGEIHSAMAAGLARVGESGLDEYLGVPALYTGPNGLRLTDAPPAQTPGSPHAYPAEQGGEGDGDDADGRRVRLDVAWGLDRGGLAGVLLDLPGNDLAADLNQWEEQWDAVLPHGWPRRRWFRTRARQRPPSGDDWQTRAASPALWRAFLAAFPEGDTRKRAVSGWVLTYDIPDGPWSPGAWDTVVQHWYRRLGRTPGTLAHPVIVVLTGRDTALRTTGPGALAAVRQHLQDHLNVPVTALSRHRPGQEPSAGPSAAELELVGRPEGWPVTEQGLRDLRGTAPAAFRRILERLASDASASGRWAALAVAADYDEDIRTWVRAASTAGAPLPTPFGLPLSVRRAQADAIALALLWSHSGRAVDLAGWDAPLLSPPVAALLSQYRTVAWAGRRPAPAEVARWLAGHPASAPAARRAGLDWPASEALRLLPPTAAPWPLLRTTGVDAETLRILLALPVDQRHALGLMPETGDSSPPGFDEGQRAERIREQLGLQPTTHHCSSPSEATR